MKILTRFIQLLFIAVPLGLFGWLWVQWAVPSGVFYAQHTVGERSPFVDELQPSARVGDVMGNAQAIYEDPAFFFVHPHRDFERVELELWFKNTQVPIVELGALAITDPDVYTLKPVHNLLIDQSDWHRLEQDGHVLLQRDGAYDSISQFLANPPSREEIATYRTELDIPYRLENYQSVQTTQTLDVSLRGHHEFKTYIKDETLNFLFSYMDMNRDEGEDVVRVTVFNEQGQPVAEARASDDGNTSDDGQADTGLKQLQLEAFGLPEGVYKVVMNTTRDVFFRKIQTPQQKIVFLNTLYIGDEVGYREPWQGATLYTQSSRVHAKTRHAQGLQTITAGDASVELMDAYEWATLALEGEGPHEIVLPVGDVELVLEGNAAFTAEQYFNPDPIKLSPYKSIEELGVDYVYAAYSSPEERGEWLVATVPFETEDIAQQDQTWKFSFSLPGIKELDAELIMHQINTIMYKAVENL